MPRRIAPVTIGPVLPAVLLTVLLAGCSGDDDAPAAAAGGSPGAAGSRTGSAPASPTATGTVGTKGGATSAPELPRDTATPRVAISRAPVLRIGQAGRILPRVPVRIRSVRQLSVRAENPGEIAGEAVAVTVSVSNDSTAAFGLGGLVVTASYRGGRPGDQTESGPSDPLTGSLPPGRTEAGVYVFKVPSRYASSLRLEVTSDRSPTIVRFAR